MIIPPSSVTVTYYVPLLKASGLLSPTLTRLLIRFFSNFVVLSSLPKWPLPVVNPCYFFPAYINHFVSVLLLMSCYSAALPTRQALPQLCKSNMRFSFSATTHLGEQTKYVSTSRLLDDIKLPSSHCLLVLFLLRKMLLLLGLE